MKARLLTALLLMLLGGSAAAQFTNVTGTVIDPNGVPYANGTISPVLVLPGGTSPTLNGLSYSPPTQPIGLDAAGSFSFNIADNNLLQPAATKWNFTVCSAKGTVNPAVGTGSQCFSLAAPITITGASQDISANLNAVALALTVPLGSGTVGPGVANQIAIFNATNSVIGDTQLSDIVATGLTYTGRFMTFTNAAGGTLQDSAGTNTVQIGQGNAGINVNSAGFSLNANVSGKNILMASSPGGANTKGGDIQLFAGNGGATNANGGSIVLSPGSSAGAGVDGYVAVGCSGTNNGAIPCTNNPHQARLMMIPTGGQYMVMTVPSSFASPWTMTLPTGPGTIGQCLTTDGTGVTSWSSCNPSITPVTGTSGSVTIGSLIMQWATGPTRGNSEGADITNLPVTCPTAVDNVQVSYVKEDPGQTADDAWYQVNGFTRSTVTTFKQGTGGTIASSHPFVFVICH
jgi:hypothetical protein